MMSPIQNFCKINHLRDFNGGTVQIVTLYVYGVRMTSFSLIAILQQESNDQLLWPGGVCCLSVKQLTVEV